MIALLGTDSVILPTLHNYIYFSTVITLPTLLWRKRLASIVCLRLKSICEPRDFLTQKVQVPGVTKNTEKENNSKMQELLRPQGQNDSKPSYLYKICNRESWILDMSSLKQKMDLKV